MATKTKKRVSATKMCRTIIKQEGINSVTGRLKKGYKYENGKVVKVAPVKKVKKK